MEPAIDDVVHYLLKGVAASGVVLKRVGPRVQVDRGGVKSWVEIKELHSAEPPTEADAEPPSPHAEEAAPSAVPPSPQAEEAAEKADALAEKRRLVLEHRRA